VCIVNTIIIIVVNYWEFLLSVSMQLIAGKDTCPEWPVICPVGSLLKPRLHDTTCCQTGCQTGFSSSTGCIVYTDIQPVVKLVWQPV